MRQLSQSRLYGRPIEELRNDLHDQTKAGCLTDEDLAELHEVLTAEPQEKSQKIFLVCYVPRGFGYSAANN